MPLLYGSSPRAGRFRAVACAARVLLAAVCLLAASACATTRPKRVQSTALARVEPVATVVAPGSIALAETRPAEMKLGPASVPPAHGVWIALINSAQRSLDVAQFYIASKSGTRLDQVIAAMERAAARGVHVRVLVDAKFAPKYPKTLARLAALDHVEVRQLRYFSGLKGILHAKYFLVDRSRAWLGSQNFDWRSLSHIHEIGVQVSIAGVVAPLQAVFDADWQRAGDGAVAKSAPVVVKDALAAAVKPPRFYPGQWRDQPIEVAAVGSPVGHLPAGLSWTLPALLRWIGQAKHSVQLQLLSMHRHARDGSDFGALYDALKQAAQRGVQVSVLVGEWSTSRRSAAELSTLQRVPGLTVRFVRVPPFSGGFIPFARVINSKMMVVDGQRTWVGTSNGSKGYFFTSRNVGVLVRGRGFAQALGSIFSGLWRSSYAETLVPGKVYPKVRVAR